MNTASAIAVDAAGDIYVAGVSTSAGTYTLVVTAKSGSHPNPKLDPHGAVEFVCVTVAIAKPWPTDKEIHKRRRLTRYLGCPVCNFPRAKLVSFRMDREQWLGRSLLSDGLQVVETPLEVFPGDAIHVPKNTHELHDVKIRAVHGPRDFREVSSRFQSKFIDIVGFKRLHKIYLNRNRPRRVRLNYRHPTLARAAVAIPFRDRALAVFGAAISPFHCGVFPILGSPTTPIVEVIYEHKDFVGWSLDIYRSLNGENFGLGRSESQNDGDQNSDDDNYLQGHVIPHQYTRILIRGGITSDEVLRGLPSYVALAKSNPISEFPSLRARPGDRRTQTIVLRRVSGFSRKRAGVNC
jgi:hypothetical protein